jgi:hypothetical protein
MSNEALLASSRVIYTKHAATKPKATELSHEEPESLLGSSTDGVISVTERAVCVSRGFVAGLAHDTKPSDDDGGRT